MNPQIQNAATAYKAASIENAPPLKIVQMLYDGAIRSLSMAETVDPKADVQSFHRCLNKADAIVSELRYSLDDSHDKALCEQLESLYFFVEDRVREAFLSQTVEPLPEAREVLSRLNEAWKSIDANAA